MIGRPRRTTDAMRARIIEVAHQRRALRNIPSNKQLAREAGISERGVAWIMWDALLREKEVPRIAGTPEEVADQVIRECGL